MFVLGVDPGLSRCGYGVVERVGRGQRAVAAGVLRTDPDDPVSLRLLALRDDVRALLAEHRPAVVAVERVFFQVNARTAIPVAQAAGVVMVEAAGTGCEVVEYSPNQVKQAVSGMGGADKDQVQRMVQTLLGLPSPLRPVDAADAVAVALCHLAHAPLQRRLGRDRGVDDRAAGASRVGANRTPAPSLGGRDVDRAATLPEVAAGSGDGAATASEVAAGSGDGAATVPEVAAGSGDGAAKAARVAAGEVERQPRPTAQLGQRPGSSPVRARGGRPSPAGEALMQASIGLGAGVRGAHSPDRPGRGGGDRGRVAPAGWVAGVRPEEGGDA